LFQFNFVGKLLGPKGNSMKRLQEETMTKMAVLGRGSMRDKQKVKRIKSIPNQRLHSSQVNFAHCWAKNGVAQRVPAGNVSGAAFSMALSDFLLKSMRIMKL